MEYNIIWDKNTKKTEKKYLIEIKNIIKENIVHICGVIRTNEVDITMEFNNYYFLCLGDLILVRDYENVTLYSGNMEKYWNYSNSTLLDICYAYNETKHNYISKFNGAAKENSNEGFSAKIYQEND
jgi:hypothetical protein